MEIKKIFNEKTYNMFIPKNDEGMKYFKNRVTYPGRSLQGFQSDTNCKYTLEELQNQIDKKNLELCHPVYIWCHTKLLIDVKNINLRISDKIDSKNLTNYIIGIPITRKVISINDLYANILQLFPEVILISDAEKIIEKYLSENKIKEINSQEILFEMEKEGIIRYSLNNLIKYHTDFIDGYYYDYESKPIPHHQIKAPELNNFKISLTEKCSQSCTYCYYTENKEIQRKDMNSETLKKSILFIYEMAKYKKQKKVKISWWGGDPVFASERLLEGLKLCDEFLVNNNIEVRHSITSSFVDYYKNQSIIEAIKKYNIDVTISCDGNCDLHNKHRMLNDSSLYPFTSYTLMDKSRNQIIANTYIFSEKCFFVENGKKVKNLNEIFKVKQRCTVYTPDEIENFNKLCDYFDNYNIQYRISMATFHDNLKNKVKFKNKINEQIVKSHDLLINNFPKSLNNIKSIFLNMLVNPADGINFCYSRCGFGGGVVIINTEGKIFSCHRFCDLEDFCLGSIGDDVKLIENNCKKYRRRWLCEFSPCNKCSKQAYCSGGGCAHEAYYYKGTTDSNAGCISMEILKNKAISSYLLNILYPNFDTNKLCLEDGSYARHCWYY